MKFRGCPVSRPKLIAANHVSSVGSSGPESPSTIARFGVKMVAETKVCHPSWTARILCHFYNRTVRNDNQCIIIYIYIWQINQLINLHNTRICSYNTVFSCHILYTVYILHGHTICIDIIYLTHFLEAYYIYTYSIYTFIYYIHILYTYHIYILYVDTL